MPARKPRLTDDQVNALVACQRCHAARGQPCHTYTGRRKVTCLPRPLTAEGAPAPVRQLRLFEGNSDG